MKILLVEELQARERLSLLMLRDMLIKKGFKVLLSSSWRIEFDIKNFKPDIVLDNISDSLSHYAGKLFGFNGYNINLTWEQILSPYNVHRMRMDEHFVDN